MAQVVPNATYSTIRRPGRVLIPNATANNLPKAGVNGAGSQFPGTNRVPTKPGNTFGRNGYENRTPAAQPTDRPFGTRSNAGVATSPTNRTETAASHPNAHFFNTGTLPKRGALVNGGYAERLSPIPPAKAALSMPHERNGIGANHGRNLTRHADFRTNMGASPTAPTAESNTPFHPQPKKVQFKRLPAGAIEPGKLPRAVQASFVSRQNLWSDPNNSFQEGHVSTGTGRVGSGRWGVVKTGVV